MCVTSADLGLSPTGGCHDSLKPISRGPTITITAATAAAAATAMVSVDPEELRGLSPSIMQPCHFLTLTPIRIPFRTAPFSGRNIVPPGKVIIAPRIEMKKQGQLGRGAQCLGNSLWTHAAGYWRPDPVWGAFSWACMGLAQCQTIQIHMDSVEHGLTVPIWLLVCACVKR